MDSSEQELGEQVNSKEPWLAVNLSGIVPGIGQIYAGKPVKGYSILAIYCLLIVIGTWLVIDSSGNTWVGILILVVAFAILPIFNLFDAYHTAKRQNSSAFESTRKQSKDAWLAVFLSGYIPGLGHAYLKQWLPSILFFTAFLIVVVLSGLQNPIFVIIGMLLKILLVIVTCYHVYIYTPVNRDRSRRTIGLFITSSIGISILLSAGIAVTIRQFIAEARYIPAASMAPTLKINDRLIIDKLTYRFSAPARGDIIVFSPTETLKKENFRDAFIKRIVGIPGDKVEVNNGHIYVNNLPLKEDYIGKDDAAQYKWGPEVVPPNSYMVLGDNRNNSYDSHYWGFVPRENIIGKATKRFFPFNRAGSLI
jgi:signal peptidase I